MSKRQGVLKLSLYMIAGLLTINVQRGRNLKASTTKRANTYVRLSLQKNGAVNLHCKTKTVRKTNNPVFNKKFSFELPTELDSEISVSVWNKNNDRNSYAQFLGSTTFVVQDIVARTRALNGWFFLLPNQTVGGGNCVASPISSTAFDLSENHVADERFDLKHKATKTVASANVQNSWHCAHNGNRLPDVYNNPDPALFTSRRHEDLPEVTSTTKSFNHYTCDALCSSRQQAVSQFHTVNGLPSNDDRLFSCAFATPSPRNRFPTWNCPNGIRITSYGWLDGSQTDFSEPGLIATDKPRIKREDSEQVLLQKQHLLSPGLHSEIGKGFESESQRTSKCRTLKRHIRNSEYIPNNLALKSENHNKYAVAAQHTSLPKQLVTEQFARNSTLLSCVSDHDAIYFSRNGLHQNEPFYNTGLLSENQHHYENLPIGQTQPDLEKSRAYYAHFQNAETIYEFITELQMTQEEATIVPSKVRRSNAGPHKLSPHKTVSCLNYRNACSRIMQLLRLSSDLSSGKRGIAELKSKSKVIQK